MIGYLQKTTRSHQVRCFSLPRSALKFATASEWNNEYRDSTWRTGVVVICTCYHVLQFFILNFATNGLLFGKHKLQAAGAKRYLLEVPNRLSVGLSYDLILSAFKVKGPMPKGVNKSSSLHDENKAQNVGSNGRAWTWKNRAR